MGRRLDDVRLAVMMLDGLGDRRAHPRRRAGDLNRGREDPARVVGGLDRERDARADPARGLVERGLDPEQAILFVLDGGKALRQAIKDVFGERALVHRCHRHKERNVYDLLPERDRARDPRSDPRRVGAQGPRARRAAARATRRRARSHLARRGGLAREGMAETLTLMRLGIDGQLAKTLCSTNPCESMIEIVRHTQRNVKRWQAATCASAGPPPGCSSPSSNSDESSATATSPSSSSQSTKHQLHSRTTNPTAPTEPAAHSLPSNHQPREDRRQSSTTIRTSSSPDHGEVNFTVPHFSPFMRRRYPL